MEKSAPLPRVLCSDILSEDMNAHKLAAEVVHGTPQLEFPLGFGSANQASPTRCGCCESTDLCPQPTENTSGRKTTNPFGNHHNGRGCPRDDDE